MVQVGGRPPACPALPGLCFSLPASPAWQRCRQGRGGEGLGAALGQHTLRSPCCKLVLAFPDLKRTQATPCLRHLVVARVSPRFSPRRQSTKRLGGALSPTRPPACPPPPPAPLHSLALTAALVCVSYLWHWGQSMKLRYVRDHRILLQDMLQQDRGADGGAGDKGGPTVACRSPSTPPPRHVATCLAPSQLGRLSPFTCLSGPPIESQRVVPSPTPDAPRFTPPAAPGIARTSVTSTASAVSSDKSSALASSASADRVRSRGRLHGYTAPLAAHAGAAPRCVLARGISMLFPAAHLRLSSDAGCHTRACL